MIFFKVPSAVADEQQDANSGKMLVSPNKTQVLVYKGEVRVTTLPTEIHEFPPVTIQRNKDVYISLEVPVRKYETQWCGIYINISVRVNGTTWQNLGNTGHASPIMCNGSTATARAIQSKLLSRSLLGASATDDYTLQFYISGNTYNNATWVNKGCDINATVKGAKGARIEALSDQNYMRLIVQEVG